MVTSLNSIRTKVQRAVIEDSIISVLEFEDFFYCRFDVSFDWFFRCIIYFSSYTYHSIVESLRLLQRCWLRKIIDNIGVIIFSLFFPGRRPIGLVGSWISTHNCEPGRNIDWTKIDIMILFLVWIYAVFWWYCTFGYLQYLLGFMVWGVFI